MKLLNSLLKEIAASGSVGAGAIAINPSAGSKRKKGKKGNLFAGAMLSRKVESVRGRYGKKLFIFEDNSKFDEIDAEAKLKNSEKLAQNKGNCKAFALEDDEGNTVKIYVKSSDANEFEKELESALNSDKSVAEIVFELNKEFDIVDAEWGELPEDEEENIPASKPGADKNAGAEGELNLDDANLPPEGGDKGDKGELPTEGGDEGLPPEGESEDLGSDSDVKSALSQIIDMLKSDIQAKKEEALAKKAEAEAHKAEQIRKAQEAKAKMDAEMLDAEDFFRKKKDEDKQQRQMELLARYRHAKSSDSDGLDLPALESTSVKMANIMFENFKKQTTKYKERK